MAGQLKPSSIIQNAVDTTGTGTTVNVRDYKNLVLQIGTASSANLTLKVQGSVSDEAPVFSSAASVSNHWDYLACYDLNTGLLVDGNTGFVVAGTDKCVNYNVNVDGINWITTTVTARAAGSVTSKVVMYNNL